MEVLHVPPNKFRIETLWAWVSVDEKGDEGICAFTSELGITPMIGADEDRLRSMRPIAEHLAKITPSNRKIRLVKFSTREEIETL